MKISAESSIMMSDRYECVCMYVYISYQHNWYRFMINAFVVSLEMSKEMNEHTQKKNHKHIHIECAAKKQPYQYHAHQNEIKSDLPLIIECDEIC